MSQSTSDPLIDPFNHAHSNADTDLDTDSIHHTLGVGAEQAAPGNHSGHLITGAVNMFAGNTIPSGWLLCDGSAVSRATYPKLFGTIGTTYGAGDGVSTFNLPNFTNAFPRGNTLGTGGSDTHQHSSVSAGTPSGTPTVNSTNSPHNHSGATFGSPSPDTNTGGPSSTGNVPAGSGGGTPASGTHTHDLSHNHTSIAIGTDGGHTHTATFAGNLLAGHQHDVQNNIPKFVGLKFIIKT